MKKRSPAARPSSDWPDVFVNDTHLGSRHAIYPLEHLPAKNADVSRYLTSEWFRIRDHVLPRRINRLHLVGDIYDGGNPKNGGIGTWTADVGEQEEMALQLLRPLAERARTVIRYKGTPYHETNYSFGGLAKGLGIRTENEGLWVQDIQLDDGRVMNVAHHPMGSGTLYIGTSLDREQVWANVAAGAGKVPHPHIIVRGHRHCYGKEETELGMTVMLPCWKLPSPHEIKANYWRFQSSIGLVTMHRDQSELYGHRFLYHRVAVPAPQPRAI